MASVSTHFSKLTILVAGLLCAWLSMSGQDSLQVTEPPDSGFPIYDLPRSIINPDYYPHEFLYMRVVSEGERPEQIGALDVHEFFPKAELEIPKVVRNAYWIRMHFRYQGEKTDTLLVNGLYQVNTKMWWQQPDKTWMPLEVARKVRLRNKYYDTPPMRWKRNQFYPIKVNPGDTVSLLLKSANIGLGSGYKYKHRIMSQETMAFEVRASRFYLDGGVIFGILFLAFMYSIVLLIAIRKRLQWYYLGYLIALSIKVLFTRGMELDFLGIDLPFYRIEIWQISTLLMSQFFLLFFSEYLELKKVYPTMQKWVYVVMGILILNSAINVPFYYWVQESPPIQFYTVNGTITLLLIIFSIQLIRRRIPKSTLMILSASVLIIAPVMGQLTKHVRAMESIYLVELFIFSLAIGNEVLMIERKRREAQARELKQLRINQDLQENINRELEEKVKERTAEIERQKEALKELDIAKSRFFANISHELRTPLTLMMNPVDSVIKDQQGKLPEEAVRLLELANKNGRSLLNLVEEILMLSKIEKGSLELNLKPVNVKGLLRRIFSSFESGMMLKGIHGNVDIEMGNDFTILLDVPKFEKILNNLLSNALKFTPEHGRISMEAAFMEDERIRIRVQDNGKGISPKDLPYVFDRYYQSAEKDAPTEGGTGIGLALAQNLAELMKGELSVESELGNGATFTFSFPFQAVEPQLAEELENSTVRTFEEVDLPSNLPKPESDYKVLIVEDNPDMILYLEKIISPYFGVIKALNGKEGIEQLEKQGADLIISDLMMPVMDGFEMLEKIKADERFFAIPVIMLTARAAYEDRLKALRTGVDDYLHKPFYTEELLTRIRNLLYNYSQRKAWLEALPEKEIEEEKTTQAPETPSLKPRDLQWLQQIEEIAQRELTNPHYTLEALADEVHVHIRQLHRRIKLLTGLTPNQYIREIRLAKAKELLESQAFSTISEVSFEVGFKNAHYFSKLFKERFGKSPGDYFLGFL